MEGAKTISTYSIWGKSGESGATLFWGVPQSRESYGKIQLLGKHSTCVFGPNPRGLGIKKKRIGPFLRRLRILILNTWGSLVDAISLRFHNKIRGRSG